MDDETHDATDSRGGSTPGDERTRLSEELENQRAEHAMQNQELRETQVDLGIAHERYRVLFDRAPVGYFVLDRNGRIERANAKGGEIVGVDSSRLAGRPFVVFLVPESHAPFFTYLADVFSAAGEQRRRRFRLITRNRTERWVTFESRIEDAYLDEPVCYVAAFDATDEVQTRRLMEASEQRYRLIVESVNDAVYLSDIAPSGRPGRFVAVNGRAAKALGYTEEELLELGPLDINAPASRSLIPELGQQLRREGRGVHELTHRRKDGSEFPVEVSSRIVVMDGQTRILSVARDITERKQAERRIAHLQRVLGTLVRADRILLRETDSRRMITEVTRVLVAEGGYGEVWITLRGADGVVTAEAQAGIGGAYEEFRERIAGGWLPSCAKRAQSDAEAVHVVRDRETECAACPLRDSYASGVPAAVALRDGGRVLGHLVATLGDDAVTRSEQVDLLGGFADNLAYALARSDELEAGGTIGE